MIIYILMILYYAVLVFGGIIMPIDGVVIRNIVFELNQNLLNGRIDKILQPEKDEIIISIRSNGKNYRLLLSSNPNYPRVCLTNVQKQNPINAPMFCMVLRKHLSGGKIVKIEQFELDRIIKIYIEGYDELGVLSNKILICEVMGRNSNIILVNDISYDIIDSLRHITLDMSSFRQIMPRLIYKYPPRKDKLDPLDFSEPEFIHRINNSNNMKAGKFLVQNIDGLSLFAAREICLSAGMDEDKYIETIDEEQKYRLFLSANKFINEFKNNSFAPTIYYNGEKLFDFYCLKLNYLSVMDAEVKSSISEAIENFYRTKDDYDRIRQKSSDIVKVVSTNLDRCLRKLAIQEETLLESEHKDKWKLFGDLIMTNLYAIEKGDSSVSVINYFDDSQSTVEIPLDKTLTPSQNAQKYYKKYNKEKSAEVNTLTQKKDNMSEIEYLENQLVNTSNCTEDIEIDEIRNELISLGYVKAKKKTASRKQKKSKPMHFISSEGIDIYVGKNNVQNDYLTLKFADPRDIWMHTKKIPGSHVIIKQDRLQAGEDTLCEAANLAAYYSKAKDSSNVPVDYTEKKNVKKPSGAKPGMVIYYTNSTIYVTPDEGLIKKLNMDRDKIEE